MAIRQNFQERRIASSIPIIIALWSGHTNLIILASIIFVFLEIIGCGFQNHSEFRARVKGFREGFFLGRERPALVDEPIVAVTGNYHIHDGILTLESKSHQLVVEFMVRVAGAFLLLSRGPNKKNRDFSFCVLQRCGTAQKSRGVKFGSIAKLFFFIGMFSSNFFGCAGLPKTFLGKCGTKKLTIRNFLEESNQNSWPDSVPEIEFFVAN